MSVSAVSFAAVRVSAQSAAFAALYAEPLRAATSAARESVLTIRP